jgi:hypothetical protein
VTPGESWPWTDVAQLAPLSRATTFQSSHVRECVFYKEDK